MDRHKLPAATGDGFDALAGLMPADTDGVVGLLRRRVEDRVIGPNKEPVQLPARRVVVGSSLWWLNWIDNKPVRRPALSDNEAHDIDEKFEIALYAVAPTSGARETWLLSSYGDKLAASQLAHAVQNMRGVHPNAIPEIDISAIQFATSYGTKHRLLFEIVNWWRTNERGERDEIVSPVPPRSMKPVTTSRIEQELSDELPF